MSLNPAQPTGKTCLLAATNTSGGGQVPSANTGGASSQYIIFNADSTTDVFLKMAQDATPTAVIPTGFTTNSKDGFWAPARSIQTITGPPNAYVAGITAASTANVYITPVDGA